MKTFTKGELISYIEEITGLECFDNERVRIDEPHIVLEFQTNNLYYADNGVHLYETEFRAIYGYREPTENLRINDAMVRGLNAIASPSYDADGEWFMVDYDFTVILKNG